MPSPEDIVHDPGWHLFDLLADQQQARFLRVSETLFREASFLDQRILGQDDVLQALSLVSAEQALNTLEVPSPNGIFHIGHCGSTLVSRAMAAAESVLPIREPLTLRQLAASQEVPGSPQWHHQLSLATKAHARVFRQGQRSMIKATSSCNALISPMLEQSPDTRALLMFVRLEPYLAGMLGKQSPPQDLQGHAISRFTEWHRLTGQPWAQPGSGKLTDAHLAVVSWLTSMARLLQSAESHAEQTLLLDFEQFLAQPETNLEQLALFFGLENETGSIQRAWPEISLGYSKKPDEPYSAFNRNRTLARGRMTRADDIRAAMQWAQELMAQHPALAMASDFVS